MITGRGVVLLVASIVAWAVGRVIGVHELHALAVATLTTVLLGLAWVRLSASAVAIQRKVARTRVMNGDRIEVSLAFRNDGRVPLPSLLVSEAVPEPLWVEGQHQLGTARFVTGTLRPGSVVSLGYRIPADHRGRYTLGPVTLRTRDPFGVAERTRTYTQTDPVVIYPLIEQMPSTGARQSHMGTGSGKRRRISPSGDEFYAVREYVSGDDLRSVHWASTAHRNTLMVRQMEMPWQAHATIFLDSRGSHHTSGPDGTFEKAVSMAATLVKALGESEYLLHVSTDTDVARTMPLDWQLHLDRLAVVQPSTVQGITPAVDATRGGEGLFVAILGVNPAGPDPVSDPDMSALHAVRGFGQRVALLVARSPADRRARHMAALLISSGWRAEILDPTADLASRWTPLLLSSRRSVLPMDSKAGQPATDALW